MQNDSTWESVQSVRITKAKHIYKKNSREQNGKEAAGKAHAENEIFPGDTS